jgi:hypothetical protein
MTEAFKQEIESYSEPLFYNTTGSPVAYKLCIRHLSASVSAGLASMASGFVYPHDTLHIVDLENEKIELVKSEIKLTKLRGLK